jgi:hypothetical protein
MDYVFIHIQTKKDSQKKCILYDNNNNNNNKKKKEQKLFSRSRKCPSFAIWLVYNIYSSGRVAIYHSVFETEWPFPPALSYTDGSSAFTPSHAVCQSPISANDV